jgi:hypothetical protein
MVVLPYDVLVLIADHFEPSELLGLAAFHRYFLHEHLIRRYQDPVVLTDHLQAQSRNNIEADLSRIRYEPWRLDMQVLYFTDHWHLQGAACLPSYRKD